MVEGAKSKIIGSPPFQLHKSTNYVQDVNAGKNLLYRVLADQGVKYNDCLFENGVKFGC